MYGDLSKEEEKKGLRDALWRYLETVQKEITPEILDSAKTRTDRIWADLETLAKLSPKQLCRQSIWWSGFLSAFAVGPDDAFDPSEEPVKGELLREQDALVDLAGKGCRVVCMISPPGVNWLVRFKSKIAVPRMRNLLNFLRGDNPALDHIDWVVAKSELKNLYIIGNICCYERFQKVEDRGDAITLRQSSAAAVRANLEVYEPLFRELARTTLNGMPPADPKTLRSVLRTATEKILSDTLEAYDAETRQNQKSASASV